MKTLGSYKTVPLNVSIPEWTERVLRERAEQDQKSLDDYVSWTLIAAACNEPPKRYHDLDDLVGTWVEDPEFDAALKEMDEADLEFQRQELEAWNKLSSEEITARLNEVFGEPESSSEDDSAKGW